MKSMDRTHSILLVDDEEVFRQRLARAFCSRGFKVYEAYDFESAVEILKECEPEMGLFDLRMPGRSGLELVETAKILHPAIKIVVLTGYGSIATASQAIKLGALHYLPKPADVDEIILAFSKDEDLSIPVEQEDLTPPSLARVEWEHIHRV